MARKKDKLNLDKKIKSRFNWKLPFIFLPAIVAITIGALFTWLWQTKDIIYTIGSETITHAEVLLEEKRLKPPDFDQKMKSVTDPKEKKEAEDALQSKALENLLKLKCVYLYAKENNVKVTKKDVDAVIQDFTSSLTGDKTKSGNIKEVLAEYGIPYRSFLSDMKSQAIYNKVLEPVRKEVTVSEEEMADHYKQYKLSYDVPETAHLLMISIATEDESKEILKKLEAKEDFAKLAKEKSLAPDAAKNGGDIGWQTKESLLKEIADNVFHPSIKFNAPYSIQARDGWYVFIVKERKKAVVNTLEKVKDQVKGNVLSFKQNQAVDSFMTRLTDKYEMRVIIGNPWNNFLKWWDSLRGKM